MENPSDDGGWIATSHTVEPRLLKIALVTMVILAVVALSVFPKDHGTASYQAVNGPTTLLETFRAALLLALILMSAAAMVAGNRPVAETVRATGHSDLLCTMRQ